jgi:hypothetical protein
MEAAAFLGAVVVPQESGVSLKPFAHILNKIGGRGLYRTRASKVLKSLGYQEHHIISNKNSIKDHKLLKITGFDLESRSNKIFLPNRFDLHKTRSVHNKRHWKGVSISLSEKMDDLLNIGAAENWSTKDFNDALFKMIKEERMALKEGKRILNSKGIKNEF